MPDYLERELGRHLAPVRAPETLWDKIDQRRNTPVVWNPGRRLIFSPALALIVLTVAAGAAWKGRTITPVAPSVSAKTIQINLTSEQCQMCHTGATLYIQP
jgi:hypothetical protein